jgi:hypothetical protein
MTEQQRPDEEVEGDKVLQEEGSADDVEGHRKWAKLEDDASDDDVEGHSFKVK